MNAPPRLSLAFRISTYFTLLIACLTLGYSEWDLVPESIAFTAVVVVTLIVSFAFEGRISLGLGMANLLGLVIGIIAVGWLAIKLTRPASDGLASLSWPANLLPYMGPLVMILMPAKLFRPKHVGDWWTMHGIGLAAIVLASSMTDDPFFLVLVALYATGAVWSLTLFYLGRSGGIIPALPGRSGMTPVSLVGTTHDRRPADGERGAWWHALLWLVLAGAVALPVFFLSPRSSGERWGFTKTRLETGYNPETSHDMNKVGDLEASAEVAFEVTATHRDGRPKADSDPDQLWRGTSYSDYDRGSWIRQQYVSGHAARFLVAAKGVDYRPPDLGPSQYELEFRATDKMGGPVLASPIAWAEGQETPVSTVRNGNRFAWPANYDASFFMTKLEGRKDLHYIQVTAVPVEPGLGPAMEPIANLATGPGDPERIVLTRMRIPKIRDWAVELLKKCVAAGRLPQAILDSADLRSGFAVQPEYHEVVGRTFRNYFLDLGEFEYTTKLRRIDKKIDPVEDFLVNARVGHCERFASGLALALRSLGIPARFVTGFKGYDATGDDGKMTIRQEHAHAWVEVLIPRPAPDDFPFKNPEAAKAKTVWHWLSLDPTPGTLAAPTGGGNWFDSARQKSVAFLNDFIIGYNPDKRVKAVEALQDTAVEWAPYFGGIIALAILAIVARKKYRKHLGAATPAAESDLLWYRRYLHALRPHGFFPSAGQTPKEFAEGVAAALGASAAAVVIAVPAFVTSKLYRVRYAGAPLTAAEEAEVAAAVATLEAALSPPTVLRPPQVSA